MTSGGRLVALEYDAEATLRLSRTDEVEILEDIEAGWATIANVFGLTTPACSVLVEQIRNGLRAA